MTARPSPVGGDADGDTLDEENQRLTRAERQRRIGQALAVPIDDAEQQWLDMAADTVGDHARRVTFVPRRLQRSRREYSNERPPELGVTNEPEPAGEQQGDFSHLPGRPGAQEYGPEGRKVDQGFQA